MSGKKDDTCGADSGIKDDLAPMRHLSGSGPAGYSSGPTHVDRADFGDTAADPEPSAAETAEVTAETPADDSKPDDSKPDDSKPDDSKPHE